MNDINFEKDQEEVLDRTENIKSLADQVKHLRELEDQLKTDEEKRLSLIGLIVRINDKVQRLINLVVRNNREAQNEPTIDAFKDLACYGIIAQIVKNGKWGK